jgi:cobalt/nickel transport system permease protein
MHLGNGAITPECGVVACALAGAGLGYLVWRESRGETRTTAISPSTTAAVGWGATVFAAQAFNFPVLPWSSGHLLGGYLLARLLGPARGAASMAIILAIQALLLGDGCLVAWGCNALNMALIPALISMGLAQSARVSSRDALGAALSVVAGTAALVLQVVVCQGLGGAEAARFAQAMLGPHLMLAAVEAGLTVACLAIAMRLDPVVGTLHVPSSPVIGTLRVPSESSYSSNGTRSVPTTGEASSPPDIRSESMWESRCRLGEAPPRSASGETPRRYTPGLR